MKQNTFRIGAGVMVLMALAARPAFALWRQYTLTANGVYDEQQFTVKTKDVENFTQFEVSIAPHPHAVSPFLTGQLSLISQDKWVASVPVSQTRAKGTVTYTFRVVPKAITQSTFEVHASFYAPTTNAKSRFPFATALLDGKEVEQLMDGTIYQMKLKDFAAIKAH